MSRKPSMQGPPVSARADDAPLPTADVAAAAIVMPQIVVVPLSPLHHGSCIGAAAPPMQYCVYTSPPQSPNAAANPQQQPQGGHDAPLLDLIPDPPATGGGRQTASRSRKIKRLMTTGCGTLLLALLIIVALRQRPAVDTPAATTPKTQRNNTAVSQRNNKRRN